MQPEAKEKLIARLTRCATGPSEQRLAVFEQCVMDATELFDEVGLRDDEALSRARSAVASRDVVAFDLARFNLQKAVESLFLSRANTFTLVENER
jgi:hypothetical protein